MIVIAFLLFAGSYHFAFAFDDWMRRIPDHKKISELTIPGTHNSYARHGSGVGYLAKCQEWTIEEQLDWGVRFFDVRFRPCGNGFTVHHGDVYQHKVGGEVFKDFKKFLSKNPTETVLVSYKDETRGNDRISPCDNSKDFKTILKGYLNTREYKPWIYQDDKVIPTVGEARGKMVFIDKNAHGGFGLRKLDIEDKWEERDLNKKVRGVKNHMIAAGNDNDDLYMTFCSVAPDPAKSIFMQIAAPWQIGNPHSIKSIAESVNPQIQSFIRGYDQAKQTFGVVIFDYPSAAIVNSLVHYNPGMKKMCATLTPEDKKEKWTVYENEKESYLGSKWNDHIGYVHLERGCYLSAYHDKNYEGTHQYLFHKRDKNIITSSGDKDYPIDNDGWIGHWWSNDISSFRCYC